MMTNQVNASNKALRPLRKLFENLVSLEELLAEMKGTWTSKRTIYNEVCKGMPHRKINGRLLFDPGEVALYLQRKSQ